MSQLPSASEIKRIAAECDRENHRKLVRHSNLLKTSRAGKLLLKGKPFVVVACDEGYYLDVYRTIRKHEQAKGAWDDEDERHFQEAVQWWCDCGVWKENP